MKIQMIFLVLLCASLMGGCVGNEGSSISIESPWARSSSMSGDEDVSEMGLNGAVYMVILNTGNSGDRLLRAESDISSAVEMHISSMEDGIMRMRPVEFIDIGAQEQVELKPGGLHIMLIGLTQTLEEGDLVDLSLIFEKAGTIPVMAEVRSP